ncbi:hypothetical protein E2C01_060211 [Portunus trituberculatus]|uniref:Uncharacterized protein n=1 Tax=Portunus trituberculatus TaxID=210409 RepID=A0A5B7HAR6_PORTR|nr:hypothetical protein [Portunus trituberculatus]
MLLKLSVTSQEILTTCVHNLAQLSLNHKLFSQTLKSASWFHNVSIIEENFHLIMEFQYYTNFLNSEECHIASTLDYVNPTPLIAAIYTQHASCSPPAELATQLETHIKVVDYPEVRTYLSK